MTKKSPIQTLPYAQKHASLFGIKHRWLALYLLFCGGFLDVVLSDAAKDLFLLATEAQGGVNRN